jgi:hypothetical protein
VPYLSHPGRLVALFAAFPLVTLPLAWLTLHPSPGAAWVLDAYVWTLGLTHFFVTLVVYASAKNLSHFAATPLNRLIYFGVPALIFLYFGAASFIDATAHPSSAAATRAVTVLVTLAAYAHRGRQAYGVLQLLKGQSGLPFTRGMRRLELAFFLVLPVLQAEATFLGDGRLYLGHPLGWATLALTVLLFATVVASGLQARRAGSGAGLAVALGYFALQTVIQCLSSLDVRLYLACDAVHYVEYHLLMYPRVTRAEPDAKPRPALLVYALVLAVAGVALAFSNDLLGFGALIRGAPAPFGFAFNMLSGIFLFHFYVDAFIWRFSQPHYAQTLKPLYFPQPVAPVR